MSHDVEHLFTDRLPQLLFSDEASVQILCPFFLTSRLFSFLSFMSAVYIRDASLFVKYMHSLYSPSLWLAFLISQTTAVLNVHEGQRTKFSFYIYI